jgi:hypothetical protein
MEYFGFGGQESHMFAMEFPRMLADANIKNKKDASAQDT